MQQIAAQQSRRHRRRADASRRPAATLRAPARGPPGRCPPGRCPAGRRAAGSRRRPARTPAACSAAPAPAPLAAVQLPPGCCWGLPRGRALMPRRPGPAVRGAAHALQHMRLPCHSSPGSNQPLNLQGTETQQTRVFHLATEMPAMRLSGTLCYGQGNVTGRAGGCMRRHGRAFSLLQYRRTLGTGGSVAGQVALQVHAQEAQVGVALHGLLRASQPQRLQRTAIPLAMLASHTAA